MNNIAEILKKHQANGYKGFFDYFFVKEFWSSDIKEILENQLESIIKTNISIFEWIINTAKTYELTIWFNDFRDLLQQELDIIIDNNINDIYKVIYFLYEEYNDFYLKLQDNFKINFWWTFYFYEINLEKFDNNLDSFVDHFYHNFKNITTLFNKKINSKSIILYYTPDNINDYFIVYYSVNRHNKSIGSIFTISKIIKSSNNFYFFFYKDEEMKKIYLVMRQAQHSNYVKKLKESINEVCRNSISINPLNIINFDSFENKWYISNNEVTINKISCSTSGATIHIEWDKSITTYNNFKNTENYNIQELWLKIIKYKQWWKDIEYKITWECNCNTIKYNSNELKIITFINYLKSLWFFIQKSDSLYEKNYWFKELFLDWISSKWKILIKNYIINKWDFVSEYIKNNIVEYCWTNPNLVEFKNQTFDFLWFNKKVRVWTNYEDLENNFYIEVDLEKILKNKNIKWKINYEKSSNIFHFSYSKQWRSNFKNIEVFFWLTKNSISNYMAWKKQDPNIKNIAFIKESFDEVFKFNLLKFNCLVFDFSYIDNFINNNNNFITEESWRIILERDFEKNISFLQEASKIDFFSLSISWEWSAFEDSVAKILSVFTPFIVKLWNNYTGLSVPDGIIIPTNDILILYDAKSSNKIRDYINNDWRKFKDYITLFPTDFEKNIFLLIWPISSSKKCTISDNDIESLWENQTWKDMINKDKWKIVYMWADVLDFLHYVTLYKDFINIKWLINSVKIFDYISSLVPIPWIKKLDFQEFYKYFKKYIFSWITEINDHAKALAENFDNRTEWKVDLIKISDDFKNYIWNYKINKNN